MSEPAEADVTERESMGEDVAVRLSVGVRA
jgi:hypothetical protein